MSRGDDAGRGPPPAGEATLLGEDEPPPIEVVNAGAPAPALVLCDHAGARIPRALGDLGLPPYRLAEHIALDLGAEPLARGLAARLDAPLLHAVYSRLVVDLNRFPAAPSSIPEVSDGVEIPGNVGLSAATREARLASLFWPYHHAITAHLDARVAAGVAPLVVAVHTFTPTLAGQLRPWHVGVLWHEDRRVARPLLAALRREPGLVVGDNQPYSAREPLGFTMVRHAEARGLPHALLEIRQDLLDTERGVEEWADRLAGALNEIWPEA